MHHFMENEATLAYQKSTSKVDKQIKDKSKYNYAESPKDQKNNEIGSASKLNQNQSDPALLKYDQLKTPNKSPSQASMTTREYTQYKPKIKTFYEKYL